MMILIKYDQWSGSNDNDRDNDETNVYNETMWNWPVLMKWWWPIIGISIEVAYY